MKFSKEQLNATANVEKSENFLFLHFATAHRIFQLFRNPIFRVLILRFVLMFKNFQQNFNEISKTFFNEIFNKIFTKFSNNISKFYHEGAARLCV